MAVLVVGLGQIGYSNAQYFTKKGLTVDGYDISDSAVKRAISDNVIRKKAESFADYDTYVICVSTHNPANMFEPSLEALYEVLDRIWWSADEDALVCIDSTIPPDALDDLSHKRHIVHCPHRYYSGDREVHGVNQVRVMAGYAQCCVQKAEQFYNKSLGIPTHEVSSIKVAALCKLVENAYRYLEIAFAEELKMFCTYSRLDFVELRDAVNTKWNIRILEARDGIGKHCLPKDSEMFRQMLPENSLIATGINIDKRYREFLKNG